MTINETISMADKRGIAVAVQVLSTLGAVLWSIQLVPQIVVNWRRKSGAGLQPSMMLSWAIAGLPLGIHNILGHQPVALQVQAQILTSLSLLTWAQVMYYDRHWSLVRCFSVLLFLSSLFAGMQIAFVLGFRSERVSSEARNHCVLSMAILAGLGLCIGVLRQHYDVYRHRTVRGIAWQFVLLDAAGDLTSLLAVVIKPPADRVAAAIYASELSLWLAMIAAGIAFNFREYLRARHNHDRTMNDLSVTEQIAGEDNNDVQLERQVSAHSSSSAFGRIDTRPSTAMTMMSRIRLRR